MSADLASPDSFPGDCNEDALGSAVTGKCVFRRAGWWL